MDGMTTIGLVGGVASGKSAVARMFAERGAGVLDADRAGHAVLAEDAEVQAMLRERWGDDVIGSDGTPNRAAMAARIFAPGSEAAADRQFLEELLHPRIRTRLEEERRRHAAAGCPAVVLDAPLLLEAGWRPMCDLVVMVEAPRSVRLARAKQRGWSEAEFERRESAQWPVEQKRRQADVVLSNSGSLDDLHRAVGDVWEKRVVH